MCLEENESKAAGLRKQVQGLAWSGCVSQAQPSGHRPQEAGRAGARAEAWVQETALQVGSGPQGRARAAGAGRGEHARPRPGRKERDGAVTLTLTSHSRRLLPDR